jgi:hypothetical protein
MSAVSHALWPAIVLLAGWIGLRVDPNRLARLRALPDSRAIPIALGLITAGVIWYLSGSLHPVPVVHDEASYLLQAQTFARWRWTMPSPPLPEFFQQLHVLVTPAFASKYPPGHALLLVPGIWLGLPALAPVLLNGLAGALLFVLVRRVANGWVALLTFLLWLPLTSNLAFRPGYFSETTSSLLWILGWWALVEWRETGRRTWLITLAACVGWMAITRPLTAVAFAIPVACVVLWRVARQRAWSTLVVPAAVGVAILALLPLWNVRTTGRWSESPYTLYTKTYLPFDVMGFGVDTTPPARPLPPDMHDVAENFEAIHAAHTLRRLPTTLFERWRVLFDDAFGGIRLPLALFALLSLAVLPASGWFAIAGSVVLTVCYLSYAHNPSWVLYYLEINPLFPFLIACGIWTAWLALEREAPGAWRRGLRTPSPRAALSALILCVLLLVPAHAQVNWMRHSWDVRRSYQASFAEGVHRLAGDRIIVFVRYRPGHEGAFSLITNSADLPDARAWLVYDRGVEDASLIARAPDRVPYLYDEASTTFTRMSSATHE